MIKIEHTDVHGWEAAIRGMRNPKNSWDKSDSYNQYRIDTENYDFVMGDNDMRLAKTLSKAGSDHGKYLRMITVTMDVTAPLYWWKEYDQYKVGTVTDSCSTMHKIHANEFTLDDFSIEHLDCNEENALGDVTAFDCMKNTVAMLNHYRKKFNETGDKAYWWQLIQLLPSSYNQKRTVSCNYAVLKNQYHARKTHKLDEWHDYCNWVESLPYAAELIVGK